VVVGNYIYSLLLGMSVPDISGKAIANLEVESLRHIAPTFHGDTIYGESEVLDKTPSKSKDDRGIVYVETRGYKQDGTVVCVYRRKVMVPKRSYGDSRGGEQPAVPSRSCRAVSVERAAAGLREFAERDAAASPLYQLLAARAADDAEVAALLGDRDPRLLLAAAHRLVQADPITRCRPTTPPSARVRPDDALGRCEAVRAGAPTGSGAGVDRSLRPTTCAGGPGVSGGRAGGQGRPVARSRC